MDVYPFLDLKLNISLANDHKHTQSEVSSGVEEAIVSLLHDRMTEQRYASPLTSFQLPTRPKDWVQVDVMNRGQQAIIEIDHELGLSFDKQDMIYYMSLFKDVLKRNPTSVELFDLAQSNSEHSRHWFFRVCDKKLSSLLATSCSRLLSTQ